MDRLTPRSPATLGLAALLLVAGTAAVTARVTGAEEPAEVEPATPYLGVRDVVCPESGPVEEVPLDPPRGGFLRTHEADREPGRGSGSGIYCVELDTFGTSPQAVRVEIAAPPNGASYGEYHVFTSDDGSDELWHFPVEIGVYGGCRPVIATVEFRNGATGTARTRIGTGCAKKSG